MNTAIDQMLKQYETATNNDKKNSIKEVVQEVVLCGLMPIKPWIVYNCT